MYEKELNTLKKESTCEGILSFGAEPKFIASNSFSNTMHKSYDKTNTSYLAKRLTPQSPQINQNDSYLKPIKLSNTFKFVSNPFFDRVLSFKSENISKEQTSKPASFTSMLSSVYSLDSLTSSQKIFLKDSLNTARKSSNNQRVISNLGIEVISLLKENLVKKCETNQSKLKMRKTMLFQEEKAVYQCSSDTPIKNKSKLPTLKRKFSFP